MNVIVSIAYFPPTSFYYFLNKSETFLLEKYEHFIKQTYRNRCIINGANGKLNLTIPLKKYNNHTPIKEIQICNNEKWQTHHWRSIVSAYNSSPFFQYYDYQLDPFFNKKYHFLWDLNLEILEKLNKLLKINQTLLLTNHYQKTYTDTLDLRNSIKPNKTDNSEIFQEYTQVFDSKTGFIPDLSILDLIFNTGPEAIKHL